MLTAILLLTTSVAPGFAIEITGARAVPVDDYIAALRLAADAQPTPETAAEVQAQLQAWLARAGYALATVRARVTADGQAIAIDVDEGTIDRILFLERLTYQQVRFKLAVGLPYDVFNAAQLDAQVEALSRALNTPGVTWQLVRVDPVEHEGPQFFGKTSPYEVRITLPQGPTHELGVDLRGYYVDGLEVELNHVGRGLLGADDRLRAAASAGVGLRNHVGRRALFAFFSRGAAKVEYATTPLLKVLRPTVWAEAVIVSRHRPDLGLENFWAFTTDAVAALEVEVRRGLRVSAGGGFEYRLLFGIEAAEGLTSPLEGRIIEQARPFLRAAHESVFDPTVLRWDRRHTIETEARYYLPMRSDAGLGWADLRYQVVHEVGWHDLWVKGRAHWTWGDVTIHDEISVGEFARGISVDQYIRGGASVLLELRYSLVRDLFKFGVFSDVAVLAVPVEDTPDAYAAEWAIGAGPSLHFLVLNMFQVDGYLGFGLRPDRRMHLGVSLMLGKVF